MKKVLIQLLLSLIVVFISNELSAQTPQFFNGNSGTSTNVFPLGTTSSNKVQWIYGPNTLSSLGGGLGTPAPFGSIQKVYFRTGSITSATAVYNITLSLAQNMGTVTGFPNATYVTGITQVYTNPTFTFTGVMPNSWYGIELQTPFPYNPNLSLVFEMKQLNTTGNSLSQSNVIANARIWGPYAAAVGANTGVGLVDFGVDIGADSLYHCQGDTALTLSTSNTGTITWSVVTGNTTITGSGQTVSAMPITTSMVTASSNLNNIIDTFYLTPVRADIDAGSAQVTPGCSPFTDTLNGSLTNTTPGVTFDIAWTPAANIVSAGNTLNPVVSHSVNTLYTMTVTTGPAQGACSFVDSVQTIVDDYTPDASYDYDLLLGCINDTVCFTNTSTLNPNGIYAYNWNFGNTVTSTDENPCIVYGAQALYNVRLIVTDTTYGCTDRDSVDIDIRHPLDADFAVTNTGPAGDDSICVGSSFIFSPITTPLAGTANMTYDWDFGNGVTRLNAGPLQQVYGYPDPGTYTVKFLLTDTLGCQDSASSVVFVDIPAHVGVTASPTDLCVGETVYFTDSVSANTFYWTWDFDDGNVLTNVTNPKHTYERSGTYDVTFSGFYLVCPDQDTTMTITVHDYPRIDLGEDVALCPGADTGVILSNKLNPAQILDWSTGAQSPSINVGLSETGYYWATTTDNGCTATDSIHVERDCYLNIPNSFSPNNDGRNDYFIPRSLLASGVKEFDMKILNRWGEVIYQTNSTEGRGWDGKLNGKEQPTGVYVYLITARWNNNYQNSFQGNVTLLR